MTLIVAFVTADAAVIETATEKKTALLPSELRVGGFSAFGGLEVVVTAFDTKISKKQNDLLEWLNWEAASGVILLTDDTMPGLVGTLGDQFNVHRFEPPSYGKKVANQLTATLTKCLRAFRYLTTRFDDGKYQQIFRLPLRNFDAPEIARMRDLCRDMMHRNYGREIDTLLKDMRERQKPKRASDYPDIYLVDDGGKHFQLGPERHAQAETAIPPHEPLCVISNRLRFGRRFDGRTHYNVSREKKASMKGTYPDCHDTNRENEKPSHINMFTNDYY